MSRIAKEPVQLPSGVEFQQSGNVVTIKGSKGALSMELNTEVQLGQDDGALQVSPRSGSKFSNAMSGTTRALLANMVIGVVDGFERKLELVGVGYRAQAQGSKLNLTLGFRIRLSTKCLRASALKRRARPKLLSRVQTSRKLARLRPKFAASAHLSPTRARVCATQMSVWCLRKRRRNK